MPKNTHTTTCTDYQVVPLIRLRPALANGEVYKPVDPDDPSVRRLAADITRTGVVDPLAVSTDGVIVSGHRRRVACQLAGITEVASVSTPQQHPVERFAVLVLSEDRGAAIREAAPPQQ